MNSRHKSHFARGSRATGTRESLLLGINEDEEFELPLNIAELGKQHSLPFDAHHFGNKLLSTFSKLNDGASYKSIYNVASV